MFLFRPITRPHSRITNAVTALHALWFGAVLLTGPVAGQHEVGIANGSPTETLTAFPSIQTARSRPPRQGALGSRGAQPRTVLPCEADVYTELFGSTSHTLGIAADNLLITWAPTAQELPVGFVSAMDRATTLVTCVDGFAFADPLGQLQAGAPFSVQNGAIAGIAGVRIKVGTPLVTQGLLPGPISPRHVTPLADYTGLAFVRGQVDIVSVAEAGIGFFGAPTSGCSGTSLLYVNSRPLAGNGGFELICTATPQLYAGMLIVGAVPYSFLWNGLAIHLGPPWIVVPFAGAGGAVHIPFPLDQPWAQPGRTVMVQALLADLARGPWCKPGPTLGAARLSGTQALSIAIQ
ncbi:MAG: hypothetical protein AAF628_20515 [Planctomycetota bacterium]